MKHIFSILNRSSGVALALVIGLTAPVLAAGGGGGGSGSGGSNAGNSCNKGYTWDNQKKMCVQASLLDDKRLNEQGRLLALAGSYDSALDTLSYVRKPNSTTLTYLGYANRKLGHVDEGIAYYHQALAIDPTNLNTREYLGEGYVSAGRTDLAVSELNKLEALCGTECDQYEQLELAIAGTPDHWQ
jgi:tetratricopeptide (TPR) repeat protein